MRTKNFARVDFFLKFDMMTCPFSRGGRTLTTYNHTLLAVCVATLSENSPVPMKIVALGTLAISHLLLDGLPHPHWYDYEMKWSFRNLAGFFVEVILGLAFLPLIIGLVFHLGLLWLSSCVLAASFLDFLEFFRVKMIIRIGHRFHFWYHLVPEKKRQWWELGETLFFISLVFTVLHYFHHVVAS